MENPFQQLVPDENPPQQQIQSEVMGSIHLKSHLAHMVEFFMAIFGLTLRDSLATGQIPAEQQGEKSPQKRKKTHYPDKPDYFF